MLGADLATHQLLLHINVCLNGRLSLEATATVGTFEILADVEWRRPETVSILSLGRRFLTRTRDGRLDHRLQKTRTNFVVRHPFIIYPQGKEETQQTS